MTIKELFKKNSNKILKENSLDDIGIELESEKYQESLLEDKKRFIPDVDYSDLSNYVKFGSAEKYYYDSITSIYKTYPYDGSLYEKLNWQNQNSDLTNHIFENLYPRVNGYVNIGFDYGTVNSTISNYSITSNPEYIFIKGGPNDSSELKLKDKFGKANKLDYSNNRNYNLYINGNTGFTTEFWLRKQDSSGSINQVIFDLWNSGSLSDATGSSYARFRIELDSSNLNYFNITVRSGSEGTPTSGISVGTNLNLSNSEWNHYTFNVFNSGSNLLIKLYKNGELNSYVNAGTSINEVTGAYIATIGSLVTADTSGSLTSIGYGKLSGSLDEFRFWKSKRTEKDIKRYWFTQVGGGTNTDASNTNLGLYFKFNEGIYNKSSLSQYDLRVLDYSGRVSNGSWTGYKIGSRSEDSAIIQSGYADTEFKDPIIYPGHPDVVSLLQEKVEEGKEYDNSNNSSIINTFPSWMLEEDSQQLSNLSQIISEYFDELYLKIKFLPEIHDSTYRSGKPITFANKLLESHGFNTTDIFVESNILETLASRNEDILFKDKLENTKNFIFQNIYNNLTYIYKSKGTEKSIRNFFRCFGIDESLIKVNLYADKVVYSIDDRYANTIIRKKYLDFSNESNFESTVYQSDSPLVENNLSYLPGDVSHGYNGTTLQIELNLPYKSEPRDSSYVSYPYLTSSIIGMHSANILNTSDYTWFSNDAAELKIYVIRDLIDSKNCYFKLTSSFLGIDLVSPLQYDVYNNEKWNLNVRFYHEKYPLVNLSSGSNSGNYIIEFSGQNISSDIILNEFNLNTSITSSLAEQHFSSNKRIYIGAHRQNFTGSILERSDIRATSARYWLSKLSDSTLLEHAKDPSNYGAENPVENIFTIPGSNLFVPANKTLCLHWDFESVTSSNDGSGLLPTVSDATFDIIDLTSGSNSENSHASLGQISRYNFSGKGDFFPRNSSTVVKREYVNSLKRKLPETLNDSDMVNILTQDDITFTRDTEPVNHYFILEKSMYQVISDEMIKFFGTLTSLNTIIGEPIQRYNLEYKNLNKLKELFFEQVQNDVDLERYMSFYKWFDQSLGMMAEQLIPISANFVNGIKTVIESHILERNKYYTKLPTIEIKKEPPITSVKSINELKYLWRFGHAPEPPNSENDQTVKCLWWNQRAERTGSLNLADRQDIFKVTTNTFNRKLNTVYDLSYSIESQNANSSIRTTSIDYLLPIINFSGGIYISIGEDEKVVCNDDDDED